MKTRVILLEVAEKLRAEASLQEAIRELEFRNAVQEGLGSLNRGERMPLDKALKLFPQWISKYYHPKSR